MVISQRFTIFAPAQTGSAFCFLDASQKRKSAFYPCPPRYSGVLRVRCKAVTFTRVNNLPIQPIRNWFFSHGEIIMSLQIHPALGVRAKKTGQSQGRISCDRTFSRDDFADAPLGDTDRFCESISCDPHRFQKIFHQNFTGMDWGHISFHSFSPWRKRTLENRGQNKPF